MLEKYDIDKLNPRPKSKRVQEKCGFTWYRTTEDVEVPLMNEVRVGHTNILTRAQWENIMKYNFYGWETATVPPINDAYSGIHNPRDLYDTLSNVWCADTCAPRLRDEWSKENKTKGQCSITAFLAQDIFGGKVYGIPLSDGNFHCYNVVGDCVFDLTSEQFGDRAKNLVYENNPEQTRETHFAKEEKKLRYECLKERLDALCNQTT